ncbi:MAG: SufD family Fe-S cluster assembly protein [Candidatus Shikimatogenerans sp. JK-2022]|nr:SufD family Fe-S cluster assembly protein [Candidatus Shikimatogenerans bostrichidophilus]MDH3005064.1 SufD family Fe-S cluster assembly protein [Candidatus Shikimatogenerans bostrichidophilus]
MINNKNYYINIYFINGNFYKIKINKKIKKFYIIKYSFKKKIYIKNKNKKNNKTNLSYIIRDKILSLYIKNKKKKKIYINLNLKFVNFFSLINKINLFLIVDNYTYLFIKENYFINKTINVLNNLIFHIILKNKSKIIYLKNKNDYLSSLNNLFIYINNKSVFYIYDINLYEYYTYNNIYIYNESNYCFSRIYGIIINNKNQFNNNYIVINNNYNYCNNKQYYIGIYDDYSISILKGLINVKYNTKNNISYQNYKNFILSNKVYVNFKPYLNIFSNNIKCTHGVNIGKVDKDFIFYLQARGINLYKSKIIFFLSIVYKIFKNNIFFLKIKKEIKNKLKLILNLKK